MHIDGGEIVTPFVASLKSVGDLFGDDSSSNLNGLKMDSGTDFTGDESYPNFGSFSDASRFFHAFLASLSVIIVSELGDKTFFIAAILAMKNSRTVVFVAAMLALVIMTILASAFGAAITVIPRKYIHYTSIALFVIFGLKMLKEAYDMSPDEAKEEYENVQSSLDKRDAQLNQRDDKILTTEDPETGLVKSVTPVPFVTKIRRKMLQFVSLVFIETFTMVFLAEWGDRSQISTVILAARENVFGVAFGSLSGHFVCTGLAVLGGRVVAQLISVKTVTYVGGVVFLICATVAYAAG